MFCGPLDYSLQSLLSSQCGRVLSSSTSQKTVRLGDKRWFCAVNLQARRTRTFQFELSPPSLPLSIARHAPWRALLCFVLQQLLQFWRQLVYPRVGFRLYLPGRRCEGPISSRSDALLEHPLPPLRVRMELGSLLRGHTSGGAHGVRLLCAPAFLVERVLASRAVYNPGQIFQCYMPHGLLVRDLRGELSKEHSGEGRTSFIWQSQDQRSRFSTFYCTSLKALIERVRRVRWQPRKRR